MNENPTGGEVQGGQEPALVRVSEPAPVSEQAPDQGQGQVLDDSHAKPQGETEIRNYVQDDLLADGRVCALFVAGRASNPMWQFALVFRDLVGSVPGMAIRYADFGQDVFNPEEVSNKIAAEVEKGEFGRYIVVGVGMGGQLVYDSLRKLDGTRAEKTTGVLFGAPAGAADIRNAGNPRVFNLIMWVLAKYKLARYLDRFRKAFWAMFGEKMDMPAKADDELVAAYKRRQAYESQFPVATWFAQSRYFYGFKADKLTLARLVVAGAVDDDLVRDNGGWDKVTQNIEHRVIAGGHGDSVLRHWEFARIVADEAGREEKIMKEAMESFG